MNKKLIMVGILIVVGIIALMSLTKFNGNKEVAVTEEAKVITHKYGEVTIPKMPEKVVVFDYASVDTLDKMGVEIMGLPKSNLPPYLSKFEDAAYEDVGTLFEPDFEKIYSMKPELIIITGRQAKLYDEFVKIAPTLYVEIDATDYMGSIVKNATMLGDIFNKEEFVAKELESLQKQADEVAAKAKESNAEATIIMVNDMELSVYGAGSRFGIIHDEFGFKPADESITEANHGQNISFEYLVEKNPQYIFVVDKGAIAEGEKAAEDVLNNALIKEIDAYKNNQIIYLTPHEWYVANGGLTSTQTMINDIMAVFK